MKTTEIKLEAEQIIKDLFFKVLESNDKEVWKKAIEFINRKTDDLELNCWEGKFIWRKVRNIMTSKYWKKFIKIDFEDIVSDSDIEDIMVLDK